MLARMLRGLKGNLSDLPDHLRAIQWTISTEGDYLYSHFLPTPQPDVAGAKAALPQQGSQGDPCNGGLLGLC